jgi:hypothetical protein
MLRVCRRPPLETKWLRRSEDQRTRSCRHLELSWGLLGPSCAALGPSWGQLGHLRAFLGHFGVNLAILTCHLGGFGGLPTRFGGSWPVPEGCPTRFGESCGPENRGLGCPMVLEVVLGADNRTLGWGYVDMWISVQMHIRNRHRNRLYALQPGGPSQGGAGGYNRSTHVSTSNLVYIGQQHETPTLANRSIITNTRASTLNLIYQTLNSCLGKQHRNRNAYVPTLDLVDLGN